MTKPKYDEKLVDELIGKIQECITGGCSVPSQICDAASALRPKPKKFYVLPEWREFVRQNCDTSIPEAVANFCLDKDTGFHADYINYNAFREATATDKPLVHIPAGKDWSEEEIFELFRAAGCGASPQSVRLLIDAIREKCRVM